MNLKQVKNIIEKLILIRQTSENFGGGILPKMRRKIFFINQQFCDYFNIPVAPEFLLGVIVLMPQKTANIF